MRFEPLSAAIRKRLWIGVVLAAALTLLFSAMNHSRSQSPLPRVQLGLMTTLPLQWSEGGIEAAITPDAQPHPAYARLTEHYDIRPIDDLESLNKQPFSLLLLAQPRAFSPTEFAALDRWVRSGGRALILADPALQWGSLYPLGDKRRPLFTSLMSPILSHWGLELLLPMTDEEPMVLRNIDDMTIRTQTAGEWQAKPGAAASQCRITAHEMLADCRMGKGRALLVADADLLDTAYWGGQGVRMLTGDDEFANLEWMERLLSRLQKGS